MRPLYESQHDRDNEKEISSLLSSRWACSFHKLPISYHVDWMLMRGDEAVAFAELKSRKNESNKYPTLILSANKWRHGLELSRTLDLPFLLVVRWTDRVGFIEASQDHKFKVKLGGRMDRGDAQDIEPVIHIPTELFRSIK